MAYLILIVDDDYVTLKLLRDTLQAQGYRTIEAMNGNEAIEQTARNKPDLITMDLQLPVMDGLDATRALKANPATSDIPIITLTAVAMVGQDRIAIEAGCDEYLSKPFNIDTLLEKIRKLLNKRAARRSIRR